MRLYGQAKVIYPYDENWEKYSAHWPESKTARQVFELNIDSVQTSCGFSIPYYEYQGERDTLMQFWQSKNEDEIATYQQKKNSLSIDGLPTGLEQRNNIDE